MGWWSSSSKPEASPVSRGDRKQCWDSRDLYFECLERAGVLEPGKEGNACAKEKLQYEGNCAKSWIDYFNKRRVLAEQQKDIVAQSKMQAQQARQR